MKDDFRSFLAGERQRFVSYVRSLLTGTSELDAEDVVQDVFLRMLERADRLAPLDNLAGYVYQSLRNRVIDSVRSKKPNVSLDVEADDSELSFAQIIGDKSPNVVEALQTEEGLQMLFEALEELSANERDVIIAHEFEGVPFKDLTKRLGIPTNTLLSHKARGLTKLKRILLRRNEENER